MITDIEDFFQQGCGRCDRFATSDCSVQQWSHGLAVLRHLCLEAGLAETVKWGHPCYTFAGRNIVLLGAFRGDFRLSFFNAALMQDPEQRLEKAGPNARHPSVIRFTYNAQPEQQISMLTAYLAEAMAYAEAGTLPVKEVVEDEVPEELIEALDADPELAEAFHRLTPGRQRSYYINLKGAKKAETRISRIERFRGRILAGKGALER